MVLSPLAIIARSVFAPSVTSPSLIEIPAMIVFAVGVLRYCGTVGCERRHFIGTTRRLIAIYISQRCRYAMNVVAAAGSPKYHVLLVVCQVCL